MRQMMQVLGLVLLIAVIGPAVASGSEGVLQERSLGADDAPVTMIEYSSLTCPHCAEFHATTLPKIKEQYITPGKLRLVYRDFPLDPLATAAAMLPHCVEPNRYFGLLEGLFRSQSTWARSQEPAKELERLSRFAGLSPAAFQSCINNKGTAAGHPATRCGGARRIRHHVDTDLYYRWQENCRRHKLRRSPKGD